MPLNQSGLIAVMMAADPKSLAGKTETGMLKPSSWRRAASPPVEPSSPFPRQRNGFWSRLVRERFLQDVRQPGLAFRYPSRVVLAYRVFIIAKKIGDICNRYSSLQ